MKKSLINRGKFICFIGIDGSGKTTLARELVKMMRERGIQYKYVYGMLKPFILKPFMSIGRKFFLRGQNIFNNYTEYSIAKREALKRKPFLTSIYRNILLVDYFLQIIFKIKMPLMFGKNIVCDRYVYDTVINYISTDMSYSNSETEELIKKYSYIAPKPDIVFLIDLPEKIAYQRKSDIPSVNYLNEQRKTYLEIGKEYEMVMLNGSKSLIELKGIIWSNVIRLNEGN